MLTIPLEKLAYNIEKAREFEVDDIPWAELAFRSTREALREYLNLLIS